jgi:general secretion pathway protein J
MTPPRRARGMTLIEVLVALTLLSLLSAGLISSFRIGQRTYERVTRLDRSWDVVIAQRFLREVLENAYPFEPDARRVGVGLSGTMDRLSLTAPMRASESAGYRRYSFTFIPRAGGREGDLQATSAVDRNGEVVESPTPPETLLARVRKIEWSYLPAGASPSTGVWRTDWAERRPPALVRLRVFFPEGDARRWPDLIVAPRVTDDANCQFDVVAQACRESTP